jgi:hypothetical protein
MNSSARIPDQVLTQAAPVNMKKVAVASVITNTE